MSESTRPHPPNHNANDRFKRRSADIHWIGLIVAASFHFVLFAFFPGLTVAGAARSDPALELIEPPSELELPERPEPIQRPAMPVIGSVELDVTIAPNVLFDQPRRDDIRPPTTAQTTVNEDMPSFTPVTVHPRLLNADEVRARAAREYPSILSGAGIGGTPVVWILLDEAGNPVKSQIHESSRIPALDSAALRVTRMMKFSAAENRGRRVRVWVQIPIRFH